MLIIDPLWKTNMHKLEQYVASSNIPTLPEEMTQTGIASFNYRHWWGQGLHKLQAHTYLKICREHKKTNQATNNPLTPYFNQII